MKTTTTITIFAGLVAIAACNQKQAGTGTDAIVGIATGTAEAALTTDDEPEQTLADGVFTYGSHRYTMEGNFTAEAYDRNATATVTFTNIPADYREFEAVYTKFLGTTPHGTAAMMPMAMEMYRRDAAEGLRCIELINWKTYVNSVVSQLKQKFNASAYSPDDDPYIQPYLPAAVLQGATPENGYRPTLPYTVRMTASPNAHQDLRITGSGRVLYLFIMGKGWDTEQRSVEVVLKSGATLYQVFNCPALYTQCKQIQGPWEELQ